MKCERVLIVDDNYEFIEALDTLLRDNEMTVVGHALNGYVACAMAAELKPTLVFMDFNMPGMNGLQACTIIKKLPSPPRVVLMSAHTTRPLRHSMDWVHADAFISKMELFERLTPFIADSGGNGGSTK
jgi:DNA-binding NarL/FixJ family response regulator